MNMRGIPQYTLVWSARYLSKNTVYLNYFDRLLLFSMTYACCMALRGLKVETENAYAWAHNGDLVRPFAA